MSRFLRYSPDQAYLLPPSVVEELGADHLCFFVRSVVSKLDLSEFENSYSAEGGVLYAPELMLSVWLYGGCMPTRRASLLLAVCRPGWWRTWRCVIWLAERGWITGR